MNIKEAMKSFLEQAHSQHRLNVEYKTIHEFRAMGSLALSINARRGLPSLWVLEPTLQVVDVAALRWAIPGGSCPVIMSVGSIEDAEVTIRLATTIAIETSNITLLIIEPTLAALPCDSFQPLDDLPMPPAEEQSQVEMQSRIVKNSGQLDLFKLDKHPAESGRAEWLVVSYGSAVKPATEAVSKARANGQRVDHLTLNTLYPVRDEVLLRATMGISHIVVAEPNDGQYFLDIKREVPAISVMHAGSNSGVTVKHVLSRLQNSPRCC